MDYGRVAVAVAVSGAERRYCYQVGRSQLARSLAPLEGAIVLRTCTVLVRTEL